MARIEAPFTDHVVAALNRWQAAPHVHPFTCGGDRGDAAHKAYAAQHGQHDWGILVATRLGWRCPVCDYVQTWAHDFMLDVPPDPMRLLQQ
jgi:hypothetical protein